MPNPNITWVYPLDASDADASPGTVNLEDIMVLQWYDDTTYPIWPMLSCADGSPTLVNTTATSSPFAFLFTTKVAGGLTSQCHFDFQNSSGEWVDGLSGDFTYNGTKATKATTWSLSVKDAGQTPAVASANAGVGVETSTTARAASTVTASPTGKTSHTGKASPTATSSPKTGLSTGAQAGIGVGVALGLLLLLALGLFLWRRKRRSNITKIPSNNYAPAPALEMDGIGVERKELAAVEKPQEMTCEREPKELDGLQVEKPAYIVEAVELP